MFEHYICEEYLKGNCKIDCAHNEPHQFYNGFCDDPTKCPEVNKVTKCIEISMENWKIIYNMIKYGR